MKHISQGSSENTHNKSKDIFSLPVVKTRRAMETIEYKSSQKRHHRNHQTTPSSNSLKTSSSTSNTLLSNEICGKFSNKFAYMNIVQQVVDYCIKIVFRLF